VASRKWRQKEMERRNTALFPDMTMRLGNHKTKNFEEKNITGIECT